jgi:GT2 family glycosyltransferase
MTDTPLLSFVMPVRDDEARLRRCLVSIRANDYPSDRREIIVVDNGSVDGSREAARDAGAHVLELPELTVAELRNRGAAVARGDILAFVDADHEIAPEWCRAAADTLLHDGVAATGDACHAPQPGTWVQAAYDALRGRATAPEDVSWLGSGNMAVRASVFRELGGFDTGLETCEDADLCQRLRRHGYRIVADPRLRSIHFGDPSTLGRLFLGELWRGRDNLRVSLRGPLGLRDLPSIAIPILDLLCLAAVPLGVAFRGSGFLVALTAGLALLGLAGLRALRMLGHSRRERPVGFARLYLVALVYDLARALALVVRRGHHRKQHRT